jgi:phage terminase small subunit
MAKKDQQKKLTEKQKKFCKEYVLSLNATQAAIKAGYKESSAYSIGSENLTKPEIKEYIAKLRKTEEENFYYSRSMSFKKLEEAQKLAVCRVFVKVTKDGEVIETPAPDTHAFLKAEELKGKLNGLYVEKTETKTDFNINCMGSVKLNNKEITLKIGKEPPKEEE